MKSVFYPKRDEDKQGARRSAAKKDEKRTGRLRLARRTAGWVSRRTAS